MAPLATKWAKDLKTRLGPTTKWFRHWSMAMGVVAVAAANGAVAYHIATVSSAEPASAGARAHHVGSRYRLVSLPPAPTPVTIPPAPSSAAPAQGASASSGSGTGGDPAPSYSAPVYSGGAGSVEIPTGSRTAPVTSEGTPVDITDPSTVAKATVRSLPLFISPGAPSPEGSLPNPNYLGAPLVLLVTAVEGSWVQAYVPVRPNGSTAWVPAADVTLSSAPCHIAIGIGAHLLVLYCNNSPVWRTTVATGAPGAPTPTGSYFVAYIVKVTDPGGPYGPYAMGTSAFSNTYYSFEGGPGQIGIHGTDQPWVIGSYASHGCVRLTNAAITQLAQMVVPGTPVEIGS